MRERPAEPVVTPSELAELASKYGAILALREAHDDARRGGPEEPDPSRAMSALAARWPGALRELDDLPLDVVRGRLSAIREASVAPSRAPAWMRAQLVFHATARGALAAKRWLAGRRAVEAGADAAFLRETASLPHAADARAWKDDLARLARPPRGRVLDLVWPRVAAALSVTEAEAKALVFGDGARPPGRP